MTRPEATLILLVLIAGPALSEEGRNLLDRAELKAHEKLIARVGGADIREIAPFTTDGCSGGLSWSWDRMIDVFPDIEPQKGERPPWESCCITHDRSYHAIDGAEDAQQSFDNRLRADEVLRACVVSKGRDLPNGSDDWGMTPGLYEYLGGSMYWAVRFGGAPCTGLPWRWGYGLERC
ncbi:MAG: hypothetical protein ACU0BB_16340 [Paracoccaceae bacterium]